MNWHTVLENIGAFAIASGFLVWLAKQVLTHSLSRDLEVFKIELQRAQAVQLEEIKNRFTVGAMSHMAVVAFDKHVQFCEQYAAGCSRRIADHAQKGIP